MDCRCTVLVWVFLCVVLAGLSTTCNTTCAPPSSHPHRPPHRTHSTLSRYFAPAGTNTKGSLSTSLRHAFGPSFGSLCLASWLLNLLNMLKSMAQSARAENRDNLLVQIAASCFEFLLSVSLWGCWVQGWLCLWCVVRGFGGGVHVVGVHVALGMLRHCVHLQAPFATRIPHWSHLNKPTHPGKLPAVQVGHFFRICSLVGCE